MAYEFQLCVKEIVLKCEENVKDMEKQFDDATRALQTKGNALIKELEHAEQVKRIKITYSSSPHPPANESLCTRLNVKTFAASDNNNREIVGNIKALDVIKKLKMMSRKMKYPLNNGTPVSSKPFETENANANNARPRRIMNFAEQSIESFSDVTFNVSGKSSTKVKFAVSFDDLNTDDELSECEGDVCKVPKHNYPAWTGNLRVLMKVQSYINLNLCDTLFSSAPIVVDANALFSSHPVNSLQRSKNSLWGN